jgi:uncharacterized GH25 family protein
MRAFGFLLLACSLSAHDMWIEPSTFFPTSGEIVGVKLRVGQELLGDPLPRSAGLFKQFIVDDASGRRDLIGREGGNPAGFLRVDGAGLHVLGYYSNPSPVELEGEKFTSYLKEEGLESIIALRAKRNQSAAKAREQFVRCAKSLVLTGAANESQKDKQLGFPLELIAERNPYVPQAGDEMAFRLVYESRPLAGALVIARNRMNPMQTVTARTGADGRVKLKLKPGGMWMLKAVHMVPAPDGMNAEWLSFWASVTFENKPRN